MLPATFLRILLRVSTTLATRPAYALIAAASLAAAMAAPAAHAQYMYLDSNGDGVHTAADLRLLIRLARREGSHAELARRFGARGHAALAALGAAGWLAAAAVAWRATRFFGLAPGWALALPLAGALYATTARSPRRATSSCRY